MCLTDLQVARAMARERARGRKGAPRGGAARGLPRHVPTRDPTPRRAIGLAVACLAVLLIVLAGCGGDDGLYGGGEETTATMAAPAASDEARITEAIEGVLVSGDPELACARFVTQAYLSETFGDRTACEQSQAPGSSAKSVKVSGIVLDGEKATAVAVPKGGPSSGDRLRVELVLEGDIWKVDSLRSNAPVGP